MCHYITATDFGLDPLQIRKFMIAFILIIVAVTLFLSVIAISNIVFGIWITIAWFGVFWLTESVFQWKFRSNNIFRALESSLYAMMSCPIRYNSLDIFDCQWKYVFNRIAIKMYFGIILISLMLVIFYQDPIQIFKLISTYAITLNNSTTNCNDFCGSGVPFGKDCNQMSISIEMLLIWMYINWGIYSLSCSYAVFAPYLPCGIKNMFKGHCIINCPPGLSRFSNPDLE